MNQQAPSSPAGGSVLDHEFLLVELLDLDSLRELCKGYADLFQIGFKLFDAAGELLVDVRGAGVDFCNYLFTIPDAKSRCIQEVARIKGAPIVPHKLIDHDCWTGQRYVLAPIVHEGRCVGRLVFGPFLPVTAAPAALPPLGERFNPDLAAQLLQRVRRAQSEVINAVVRHLVQVIETMLFVGYKQVLTSRMHIESVTASFSELQEKNQALQKSFERLRELDRLKSNFLATVSHELRTPLTSVIGYTEMLLEGLAGEMSPEQRGYVGTIMEKGEQLLQLITSILDFSKIESGSLRLEIALGDLREIIRTTITTVYPMAQKLGVAVEFVDDASVPSLLMVDGGKIRQVVTNIMGNAVKFNRQGGRVTVRLERIIRPPRKLAGSAAYSPFAPQHEEFVGIVVADTGVGIPANQLDRIFDSFYQVDGSSTREYGGTGLGLAIVKGLVEAHNGLVEVQSELGKGSMFLVLLPLESAA